MTQKSLFRVGFSTFLALLISLPVYSQGGENGFEPLSAKPQSSFSPYSRGFKRQTVDATLFQGPNGEINYSNLNRILQTSKVWENVILPHARTQGPYEQKWASGTCLGAGLFASCVAAGGAVPGSPKIMVGGLAVAGAFVIAAVNLYHLQDVYVAGIGKDNVRYELKITGLEKHKAFEVRDRIAQIITKRPKTDER